ncbi:CDP-diacylglycerol--serine O-phosphatidyltransferase [Neolecta irregularis DAH-3]|uniref:CDP-diacylglycerol--serine O-phosphatidyltransferase n=1 Tax=Neolecta irregularis (strain DAH-3) TaxID=1198029 RepID=A0A1U7LK81_NEOID|nr:CDP-diacylglycerol--serine O-phosphatidyltransferase [Neolecta irregularis DAH-3]|eukprot:OLL23054.1 CDP-diacylglycerol--serine O-phosphatidyltransferase [Neolecta irregularis DAH-3]
MSVFSSMRYCLGLPTDFSDLTLAMVLIPMGLFFDFMDGKVARWRNRSSFLGQELDSLADLISFGVAPAACAFAIGFRTFADTIVLSSFVLCGLSRLARFNVTVSSLPKDVSGKSKYFEGTPIPTTLGLVMTMAYWLKQNRVLDALPWGVKGSGMFEIHPIVCIFILHGSAMLSKTLRIPKL